MTKMPFAVERRGVTACLEYLGQGLLLVADALLAGRPQRPEDADAVGVAAGQQGGPRRRANRLGDVKVREADALSGHAIEIGRGETFGTVAADVAITLVVGENDHDVGRPVRLD